MTVILLVRHGNTAWVSEGRIPGRLPGVPLDELGRRQVAALGRRLAHLNIATIYSSEVQRAWETAQAIAGPHGLTPIVEPGLIELDCKGWEGRSRAELEANDPAWRAFRVNPKGVRAPGGEEISEVRARVVAALEAIAARHPHGLIVAVSHADPLKAGATQYVGVDLAYLHHLAIDTASLSVLSLKDGRGILHRWNEVTDPDDTSPYDPRVRT
ncbi:MAG: histidine phosphatase family protein [Anaerolineae bacterium]|nr:histidine phosphatase family protein [Anaerolineae bacterium]